MTREKYITYSVDELLEDKEFISFVLRTADTDEWHRFIDSCNGYEQNILEAQQIIRLFNTPEIKLPQQKSDKLWANIRDFNAESVRIAKVRRMKYLTWGAASILLFVMVGVYEYFNILKPSTPYQFADYKDSIIPDVPLLVLSSGQTVNLSKKESEVTVLRDKGAFLINKDSIINNHASHADDEKNSYNEIIIPYGKKSKLELEDGTKVYLNAGSRLAFPQKFRGKKREVFLDGEGYFEVAKNANMPFVVKTSKIDIEVLGTRFNVSSYQGDAFAETVLLEGKVEVCETGKIFSKKTAMLPNQKAIYSAREHVMVLKNEEDPALYISWIEGWYQFSDENIETVLAKIERYYNVTFKYDQRSFVKALPVSGKLDLKDSIQEVMAVLSKVAKFKYQIIENEVIIK